MNITMTRAGRIGTTSGAQMPQNANDNFAPQGREVAVTCNRGLVFLRRLAR